MQNYVASMVSSIYNSHMNINQLIQEIYAEGFTEQQIADELTKLSGKNVDQSAINRLRHNIIKTMCYEKHRAAIKMHRRVCKKHKRD